MQVIKEYIFSLMIISIGCGAVSMLAPEGTKLKGYIKFLISLIITVIILSPLSSLMDILPEIVEDNIKLDFSKGELEALSGNELIVTETCSLLKKEIGAELKRKLSVEPENIEIDCVINEDQNVVIDKVEIIYDKENGLLFSDTEKLISKLFMDECEVICRYEGDE